MRQRLSVTRGALKPFFQLLSSSAIGQLFLFLILPVITRLYDKQELGYFASAFALASVITIAVSGRYELALTLPKQHSHARLLLHGCLRILLVSSLLSALVILLTLVFTAVGHSFPLILLYSSIPVSVFFIGLFRAYNFYAIRNQAYSAIAITKFSQNVANGLCQIGFGFVQLSSPGLLLAHTVGQGLGAMKLRNSMALKMDKLSEYKRKKLRVLLKRYKRFPQYDLPAAFIDSINVQLPNLVFAILFSPVQAGLYMLAERLLFSPVSMLAQAASQVYLGKVSTKVGMFAMSIKMFFVLAVIAILMLVTVVVIPIEFFTTLLGKDWQGIGPYLSWVVLAASCQLVYSPLSMLFVVTQAQTYNLITQVTLLVAKVLAVYYAYLESDVLLAVKWLSISTVVVYSLALIFLLIRSKTHEVKVKS